nr:hypothetical protein [Tanacetum cinerariifolium]
RHKKGLSHRKDSNLSAEKGKRRSKKKERKAHHIDSETAIVVNGSKARERETVKKPNGKKEEQKQRRCLPHRPLTIYPRSLSLLQRDSLFLEQARRYQDKILAEAEKEEEKEERTTTITSLDELQLRPFVNEGIKRLAKGSTAEFQDYETKSWD